jgi:hypothetical protein
MLAGGNGIKVPDHYIGDGMKIIKKLSGMVYHYGTSPHHLGIENHSAANLTWLLEKP